MSIKKQFLAAVLVVGLLVPAGSWPASWVDVTLVLTAMVTGESLREYGSGAIRRRLEEITRKDGHFTNTNGLVGDLVLPFGAAVIGFGLTGWATSRLLQVINDSIAWATSTYKPVTDIKTRFTDVGGAQAAKQELMSIVEYFKNPGSYDKLGARAPRGVLFWGPPGNGKTLLALALAGEAGVPFFSVKGSEFVEMLVGVGALRVRQLFAAARKCAPCIIFFDEFDSLAATRTASTSGGDRELAQTLNQLLAELDGFEKNAKPIIVIAATNRPDTLDIAATRPGRFDQKIEVSNPDLCGRKEILTIHLRKITAGSDVDVAQLARCTQGFSGAQLEVLVNQAARAAVARHAEMVAMHDFDAAYDTVLMGSANDTLERKAEDLMETAYHEAGHALVMLLLPTVTDPLHKVTIQARGTSLGSTWSLPEGERSKYSKDELLADIMIDLGGRVGEELGTGQQFTGVSADLEDATAIARDMVRLYGMSELGLISCGDDSNDDIDHEVNKIIADCETKTRALLTENRDKLEKLAHELLAKKTLSAQEVYALLGIEPRTMYSLGGKS